MRGEVMGKHEHFCLSWPQDKLVLPTPSLLSADWPRLLRPIKGQQIETRSPRFLCVGPKGKAVRQNLSKQIQTSNFH